MGPTDIKVDVDHRSNMVHMVAVVVIRTAVLFSLMLKAKLES